MAALRNRDPDVDDSTVGQRLHPETRIRSTAEYRAMAGSARRFFTPHLVVQYHVSTGPRGRFGVTVSRKVGGAVVRNRLKRWVREHARRNKHDSRGVWDVVWILRRGAGTCPHERLDREMESFWTYLARREQEP